MQNTHITGKEQFDTFTKERLKERTVSIHEAIAGNKSSLFGSPSTNTDDKSKQKLISIMSDVQLFLKTVYGMPDTWW